MECFSLFLIKPNATEKRLIGKIIQKIEKNNFNIEAMKLFHMNKKIAAEFYKEHKHKNFYDKLLDFMNSGKTVAMILKKNDCVEELRKIVGDTNPKLAAKNTIRALYGEDITHNAVHASDSIEHARREISIIFPDFKIKK